MWWPKQGILSSSLPEYVKDKNNNNTAAYVWIILFLFVEEIIGSIEELQKSRRRCLQNVATTTNVVTILVRFRKEEQEENDSEQQQQQQQQHQHQQRQTVTTITWFKLLIQRPNLLSFVRLTVLSTARQLFLPRRWWSWRFVHVSTANFLLTVSVSILRN